MLDDENESELCGTLLLSRAVVDGDELEIRPLLLSRAVDDGIELCPALLLGSENVVKELNDSKVLLIPISVDDMKELGLELC